jgi:hypothetical protein
VTDVTIHSVIELKAGKYQKNVDKHRICEMHQDAHIFQRLNLGETGLAKYLESGICGCCDAQGGGKLDPAIKSTWQSMLEACYTEPALSESFWLHDTSRVTCLTLSPQHPV